MENREIFFPNVTSNRVAKLLAFSIVFFATLQSVYFYSIGLAVFPVLSFLLLFFGTKTVFAKSLPVLIGFYAFFLINALIGFSRNPSGFYLNSMLGVFIGPLYWVLFLSYFLKRSELLVSAIKWTIVVHLVFFLIQFLAFYVLGVKVEFLSAITGEESRINGSGTLTGYIRSSGLFNEPASYSIMMSLLAFSWFLFTKKFDLLIFFILLTCIVSFSFGGILFSGFLFFYTLWQSKIQFFAKVAIFALLVIGVSYFIINHGEVVYEYIKLRIENIEDDNSANARFLTGLAYFFKQGDSVKYLGMGLGNYPEGVVTTVGSGLMAVVVNFGFIGTLVFLGLFAFAKKLFHLPIKLLLFFFLFMFSTMTFLHVYFWMFFSVFSQFSHAKAQQSDG